MCTHMLAKTYINIYIYLYETTYMTYIYINETTYMIYKEYMLRVHRVYSKEIHTNRNIGM